MFALILLLTCLAGRPAQAQLADAGAQKAVIFAYSRIGDHAGLEDSLPAGMFENHILEIVRGEYNAVPLGDAVAALQTHQALPANTIVLTFDAADRDVYELAWPLLKKHNLPFTLFIASSMITDQKTPGALSWAELKDLADDPLVTIGLHPDNYTNMALWDETAARTHINNAKSDVREKLGIESVFFAYPYGTLNDEVKGVIAQSGFEAALGQQSGAAHPGSDFMLLPRFTMNSDFGSLNRFTMTAQSLSLPVTDVHPGNRVIGSETDALALGFSLDESLEKEAGKLSCFSNSLEKPETLDIGNNRIEIRLPLAGAPQRLRINCTLPAPEDPETRTERWRWLGFMFHVEHIPTGSEEDHQE